MIDVVFEGIVERVCADIEPYRGSDKRLKKKGFTTTKGILVLRGFASLRALASNSETDYNYQRENCKEHAEQIAKFLDDNPPGAKMIQELVLSAYDGNHVLKQFTINTRNYKTAMGDVENLQYYSLKLDPDHKLKRIDGNHRLYAADFIDPSKDYQVPFCILINEIEAEVTEETKDINQENEAFIFYFLNGKAKKLLPSEMYKGLVKSKHWNDEELAKANLTLPYLRKAVLLIERYKYDNIAGYNEGNYLHDLANVFNKIGHKELSGLNINTLLSNTNKILKEISDPVNDLFAYFIKKFKAFLLEFLVYFVFKQVEMLKYESELKKINNWLKTYNYTSDSFTCPVKMYSCIQTAINKKISVFMAMPYPKNDPDTILEEYNNVREKVLKRLLEKGYNLEFHEIMTHKHGSEDILQSIHTKIEQCSVFIADVTGDNFNVLYEVGLAKGMGKPYLLLYQEVKKGKKPKAFDIITEYKKGYIPTALSASLGKILENQIIGILQKEYGVIHE